MNVLLIGSGGREHALARAIVKNPMVERLYALPGNAGIAQIAQCVPVKATDIAGVVAFAKAYDIGFAVVAPDDPLALGAVDALHVLGIPCFGPEKNAAMIEASKAFSKSLMKKYGIPTADYAQFTQEEDALAYLKTVPYPAVVKADGLALGKGVTVAQSYEEAAEAVHELMAEKRFGKSGDTVLIEECLTGPEVSVLAFTDGHTVKPLPSSMDHKRACDGDLGPNTGGVGAVAPNPYYTGEIADVCMDTIYLPTIRAMAKEGRPFKGCLYFGLMLTPNGPKVIEYNCRFGDPETQAVLPLLETDLFDVMRAVEEERLSQIELRIRPGASCCVILYSDGLPRNLSHRLSHRPGLGGTTQGYVRIPCRYGDQGRAARHGGRTRARGHGPGGCAAQCDRPRIRGCAGDFV